MRVVLALLGVVLILSTWTSVLTVLVVTRRSENRLRRVTSRSVRAVYALVTRRITSYAVRDRILAAQAATAIIVQLFAWLGLFYVGFALLIHGIDGRGFAHSFDQSGSSLFTLGYVGPAGTTLSLVSYLEAATGLIVVALQIGYLPTLYSAYNRREVEVTLLSARAGVPAWGPEILARTRFGFADSDEDGKQMDDFYLQWERWAADVAESHTNYPVLLSFRSPAKYSSWVVALLAVLDSAALWLALSPARAPASAARLVLQMGFGALQGIALTIGIEVDRDPDPDGELQLSWAEYCTGIERIASTSFRMDRSPEQAWPDFRGWRVNYESVAYAIAARLDAVPAPWSGPRRSGDQPVAPVRPRNRTPTPYRSPTD